MVWVQSDLVYLDYFVSSNNVGLARGHSMSGDPAKWGFFIWPPPKFTKFYKGKDLRLVSSTKLEFLKSDQFFRNYEHLKFDVTPLSLNIFIQYFAVKWKAPCWTKQHRMFFTGDLWTLVNRCYKATFFHLHANISFQTFQVCSIPSTKFFKIKNMLKNVKKLEKRVKF